MQFMPVTTGGIQRVLIVIVNARFLFSGAGRVRLLEGKLYEKNCCG